MEGMIGMRLTTDDRAAVQDVVALHGHLTDDGEFDRMTEVFSDDVVYDVSAPRDGSSTRM